MRSGDDGFMGNPGIGRPQWIGLYPTSGREIFRVSLDSANAVFDVSCPAGRRSFASWQWTRQEFQSPTLACCARDCWAPAARIVALGVQTANDCTT